MIDGSALVALVDDLDEFKLLVPQSGLGFRLKKIISNNVSTLAISHVLLSSIVLIIAPAANNISDSMAYVNDIP